MFKNCVTWSPMDPGWKAHLNGIFDQHGWSFCPPRAGWSVDGGGGVGGVGGVNVMEGNAAVNYVEQ